MGRLGWGDPEVDPDVCTGFESTEVALWIGGLETEPDTVFCAEPTDAGGL